MRMRQALNRMSAGWRGAENRGDTDQRWLRRRGRSAELIIIKCYWMSHSIIVDIVCQGRSGGEGEGGRGGEGGKGNKGVKATGCAGAAAQRVEGTVGDFPSVNMLG